MSQDPALHFRRLASTYSDTIRANDTKANITIVFVAIMMPPVLVLRDKYPPFLSLPIVLAPFLLVFVLLLISLYPRYPKRGRDIFPLARNTSPDSFVYPENQNDEILHLRLLCAILSQILFWKTVFLQISLVLCLLTVIAASIILAVRI
jgi:hypothetical protein